MLLIFYHFLCHSPNGGVGLESFFSFNFPHTLVCLYVPYGGGDLPNALEWRISWNNDGEVGEEVEKTV